MTGMLPSFRTCLKMGLTIGLISMAGSALPAATQTSGLDSTVVEARDAARKQDRNRLAAARAVMQAAAHPLTSWLKAEYVLPANMPSKLATLMTFQPPIARLNAAAP